MFKKYFTIFVLCALCAFVTSNPYDLQNVDPIFEQHQLAFKLVRHAYGKRMSIVGTSLDDECFDYYYKEQDEIFTEYNKDFNICRTDARAARAKLQAETSEKREGTIARGDLTCSDLKNCDQYTDGIEFFECYSSASGGNYQELYNLYLDSNAETTNIKISTQSITNDENKCTTTAKNKYVASMANCNSNLDKCLGGAPLPTVQPTASTPESSEETDEPASSSTEPPTSSTPESSEETDEPASSSTEPPISSTSESSEETDEPASSSSEPPTSSTPESSEETDEPASSSTEPPTSSTPESSEETDAPASSSAEPPTSSTPESSEETGEPESSSTDPPSSEETDAPESSESTLEPEAPEGSTTEPPPEEDLISLKSNFNLWNLLKKFRT